MRKKELLGKKTLAVFLASAMVLSLAGCGGGDGKGSGNEDDVATGSQTEGDTVSADPAGSAAAKTGRPYWSNSVRFQKMP